MGQSTIQREAGALDFESIYVEAQGDATRIPWAHARPNPSLVNWLNAVAPSLIRCGARVCVVGCGLGEEARELLRRGYDVLGFDISPTAIEWAASIDPENAASYVVADLFDMPPRWRHRFDLVVEVHTLQSLPPSRHRAAMAAMAELVARHGHLLAIARGADEMPAEDAGPPWPLTVDSLRAGMDAAGLAEESLHSFLDDNDPPVQRLRGQFCRR